MGHDPPGRLTWLLHPKQGRHTRPPELRHAGGPLGDRAGQRVAPEHHPQPAVDAAHAEDLGARRASTSSTSTSRSRRSCPRSPRHGAVPDRRHVPLGRRAPRVVSDREGLLGRVGQPDRPAHRRLGGGARRAAEPHIGGPMQVIPNGIDLSAGGRSGRAKRQRRLHRPQRAAQGPAGPPARLAARPREHTGARLRLVGADPLSVRWLARRQGFSLDGVDLLGGLSEEELTAELQAASLLAAPSLGGESFGMVLTRAFACATPVVASDIEGYAQVADHDETGILFPPGDRDALASAMVELLQDEERRRASGIARARPRSRTRGNGSAGGWWRSTSGRRTGRGGQGSGVSRLRVPEVPSRPPRSSSSSPSPASSPSPFGAVPIPGSIERAFRAVEWRWVAVAVLINLFSVAVRCARLDTSSRRRSRRPGLCAAPCSLRSASVSSATRRLPGRVGELARVAVITRHIRRRPGTWATIVGTVFAHRLFDVVVAVALVLFTLYVAPIPDWAAPVLAVVIGVGLGLLLAGFVLARRHHRPLTEELGPVRRVLHMARHGLTVLRRPRPAIEALFFQTVGWVGPALRRLHGVSRLRRSTRRCRRPRSSS